MQATLAAAPAGVKKPTYDGDLAAVDPEIAAIIRSEKSRQVFWQAPDYAFDGFNRFSARAASVGCRGQLPTLTEGPIICAGPWTGAHCFRELHFYSGKGLICGESVTLSSGVELLRWPPVPPVWFR